MTPDETERFEKRHAESMRLARMLLNGLTEGTKGWPDRDRQVIILEALQTAMLRAATVELVLRWTTGRGLDDFPIAVQGNFSSAQVVLSLLITLEPVTPDDDDDIGDPPSLARH